MNCSLNPKKKCEALKGIGILYQHNHSNHMFLLGLSKMEVKDYNLGHAEPGDPDNYREAAEEGVGYGNKESS